MSSIEKSGIKVGDINDPEWVVDRLMDLSEKINELIEEIDFIKERMKSSMDNKFDDSWRNQH